MQHLKNYFFFFFLVPMVFNAQEAEFSTDISDYLDSNGTMSQYEYAYGELLKMLGSQFPKTENNVEGWKYMEENKNMAVNEMKSLLIPIYKENFTHGEIKEMTSFYKSEAGELLINDRSKMTDLHKEELNTFYNSVLGKKILEKQEILTQKISKVSESWSRDLYETALSLLNIE